MARIDRFARLALPILIWLLSVSTATAAPPPLPREESIPYQIQQGQNLYPTFSK